MAVTRRDAARQGVPQRAWRDAAGQARLAPESTRAGILTDTGPGVSGPPASRQATRTFRHQRQSAGRNFDASVPPQAQTIWLDTGAPVVGRAALFDDGVSVMVLPSAILVP